ncbi:unnamed protein product, partial [Didymodactylos carnosus]
SSDSINELVTVLRLSESIKELRLINCGLRNDFISKLAQFFPQSKFEHFDLSHNSIDDKSLIQLSEKLQQRKIPLITLNFTSCNLTHKSVHLFNTALSNNPLLSRTLTSVNFSGNKLKEETDITVLFSNENNIEELQLGDNEFNVESLVHALSVVDTSKLRRFSIINSMAKSTPVTSTSSNGFVKTFFQKTSLQLVQLINTDLSNDFLREICDGLHSNINLEKLDLRLNGNNLEVFIRDYAARFASIPSLVSLDLTNCDLDNELPHFLFELKKNRKLKSLNIGRNFNSIKSKNFPKTIHAMKELLAESNLEAFHIPESKLREANTGDLLSVLMNSPPLKLLDIRGNQMLDHGARILSHVLQQNRHLHTVYFDRNSISLNGFEEIVNAMEGNYAIRYLPIPVNDIIAMKINEKDNRISSLMTKLDSFCIRNQNSTQYSSDALEIAALAGTSREAQTCWENQQQLCGDFASMEYANSYGTSANDLRATIAKMTRIAKIPSQLFECYSEEEKKLQNECEKMCLSLQKLVKEHNERLSKKFYQIFKDQSSFNYDDKFQEQIRTYFQNSNETTEHLLKTEVIDKLSTCLRECYISVATCVQKRAFDTTNKQAMDMHRDMEAATFQGRQNITDNNNNNQNHSNHLGRIAIDRLLSRNAMFRRMGDASNCVAFDHSASYRLKKADSVESLDTTKSKRTVTHPQYDTNSAGDLGSGDQRSYSNTNVSSSPKLNVLKKSIVVNNDEQIEGTPLTTDPIYGNVINYRTKQSAQSPSGILDEGGIIEHDLLDLVAKEQEKEAILKSPATRKKRCEPPPALPKKDGILLKRAPVSIPTTSVTNLDVEIESAQKLEHTNRPRRQNVRRPIKRSVNGAIGSNESSSDGLITDDDEIMISESANLVVQQTEPPPSSLEASIITDQPKSALKTNAPRDKLDELKQPQLSPQVQLRSSIILTGSANKKDNNDNVLLLPVGSALTNIGNASLTKAPNSTSSTLMSTSLINNDITRAVSTDNDNEQMIRSAHGGLSLIDENSSSEPLSPRPSTLIRPRLPPGVPRVLPLDTDVPPVRLRHIQSEKKAPPIVSPSLPTSSQSSAVLDESSKNESSDINNEQYKRLSVKERARLLTTSNNNNSPTTPIDPKKQNSTTGK